MNLEIELEREEGGCWIAEVLDLTGLEPKDLKKGLILIESELTHSY